MYISFAHVLGISEKEAPNGQLTKSDEDFTMYLLLNSVGSCCCAKAVLWVVAFFRASFVAPEVDLIRGE